MILILSWPNGIIIHQTCYGHLYLKTGWLIQQRGCYPEGLCYYTVLHIVIEDRLEDLVPLTENRIAKCSHLQSDIRWSVARDSCTGSCTAAIPEVAACMAPFWIVCWYITWQSPFNAFLYGSRPWNRSCCKYDIVSHFHLCWLDFVHLCSASVSFRLSNFYQFY